MIQSTGRSRDLIIYHKGDTLPVSLNASLLSSGWVGGQGVSWRSGALDRWTVGPSEGQYGGFLLWGSDESADQYTSLTRAQVVYGTAVLGYGGWLISTTTYERYTYASRIGGGPLVALTYAPNDVLYFSLRGYWTKEQELVLSGSSVPSNPCGRVASPPKAANHFWLGVHTAL